MSWAVSTLLLSAALCGDALRHDLVLTAEDLLETEAHQFEDPLPCKRVPTEYDDWLGSKMTATGGPPPFDSSSVLFVIDMQVDFVSGSFAQPCPIKREELTSRLDRLIQEAAKRKSYIIASMDYHPEDHCSFKGLRGGSGEVISVDPKTGQEVGCKNALFLTEADRGYGRYHNLFPKHTAFQPPAQEGGPTGKPPATGRTRPEAGALFHPTIAAALRSAATQAAADGHPERVAVVFKAFNRGVDSFSAFPHLDSNGIFEPYTGGFAMSDKGTPAKCFEAAPAEDCFPTLDQLANAGTKMHNVSTLIEGWSKTLDSQSPDIFVSGLVLDFCVKETAIYAKQWVDRKFGAAKPPVKVLVNLARPSFEGCAGVVGPLGSPGHFDGVANDFCNAGVGVANVTATSSIDNLAYSGC